METETLTFWGFIVSIIGTLVSLGSLTLAFIIRNNTKRIGDKIFQKHLRNDYKKDKVTIIQQLDVIYELYDRDKTVDSLLIKKTLISIRLYEDLYSRKTIKLIKNIEKKIKKSKYEYYTNGIEDDMLMIYNVKIQLEKDYGIHRQEIEEELK